MACKPAWMALALGLLLGCGVVAPALAQGADGAGQQPSPKEQPSAAQLEQPKCVSSNAGFKQHGKAATFEIELQNTCDMRLKCTVDAFVIGARGPAQGHGTLILAAAPKGQTTHKTYVLKVKSAGGMANVSHSCKSI